MSLQHVDLNIWDSGLDEGKDSAWQIDIYPDVNDHTMAEQIIYLSDTQVEMLGLNDEGEDWWTDPVSFLFNYSHNMPRKVRRILEGLEVAA